MHFGVVFKLFLGRTAAKPPNAHGTEYSRASSWIKHTVKCFIGLKVVCWGYNPATRRSVEALSKGSCFFGLSEDLESRIDDFVGLQGGDEHVEDPEEHEDGRGNGLDRLK